jgi:hypothetical protein
MRLQMLFTTILFFNFFANAQEVAGVKQESPPQQGQEARPLMEATAKPQSASTATAVIKQVLPQRNQAMVEYTGDLSVGTDLIATFEDGKQCSLKISKVVGALATVDTSMCKTASDLVVGQKLDQSLFENTPQDLQAAPVRDGWHFGVGGAYALPENFVSTNGTVSGYSGTFSVSGQYYGTVAVELDARILRKESWGFIGALTYDGQHYFLSGTATVGGQTTSLSGNPSSIQTTVLSGSAAYRWGYFYLPFGLNFNTLTYTPPSGFAGSASSGGGLGAQLGVGFYITDKVTLELIERSLTGTLTTTTSTGVTTNYGTVALTGTRLVCKYLF